MMRFQIGRLTLVAFLRFHSSFVTILYPFPNLHPAVTVRVIDERENDSFVLQRKSLWSPCVVRDG